MKTVLVQVAKDYLCLTACEPAKALTSKDNKKAIAKQDIPYSFTSPFIVPIIKEDLEDAGTIWEKPKLLAEMVKNGLRKMKRGEIKEVMLLAESFDLTCQEYQHIKSNKKVLNSLAVNKIQEFVGENINDFSVIYKDYNTPKATNEDVTAKAFAMPKALIDDLTDAFKDNMLQLIKVVPTEVGMLHSAKHSVYSFDKTVLLLSMDYCAVRALIVRNGLPMYCHTFHSPMEEYIDIIAADREIVPEEALEYIRTNGYGFQEECRTPIAERRLEEVKETLINEILCNINLVLMSLNLQLDQIYLSDFVGYMPRMVNYVRGFGLAKEVNVVSDCFNSVTVIPELSVQARDEFYKSGAFLIFNELMNSGTQFDDNMMIGLKASVAKNVQSGKKMAIVASVVLAAIMVLGGGAYAFLNIRETVDTSTIADPKYDKAKDLIKQTETLDQSLKDQASDTELLPHTKLYLEEVITQLNNQVVSKVDKMNAYSLTHTAENDVEAVAIPIGGNVKTMDDFISLKTDLRENGFFITSPVFSVTENTEDKNYSFSTQLAVSQQEETTEAATEAATTAQ